MFIATVVIVITLLNILVYKLLQLQESNSGDNLSVSSSLPSEQTLCRRFSLAEILSATHKFDESFVIGRGGFGKVYKGVVDNGATTVAIKRLNSLSKQGAPEFWTEIEMLSKFRHSHLVPLIGYCDIYNEMILVYEYMVHGTVADHLHKIGRSGGDKSPLSWVRRLKICIGAARGLDYLHTGTGVKQRVIHRDVKSSNILLDENWAAKISDFGLSKIGPADQSCTHVSTYVKGTCGYMDPEYLLTRRLTRKSDVYSFGVVLFEVLCGRPAMDGSLREDQRGLARLAKRCIKEGSIEQIIDPNLRGEILPNCLSTFVQIAGKCLHSRPKKRPTMTEVVSWLEFALALQERKDSSIVEEEVFNATGVYDNQEHANYSTKREVINADNGEHHYKKIGGIIQVDDANRELSPIKPAKRRTFAKKVRFFFSVRRRVIPVMDKNRGAASLHINIGSTSVVRNNLSNANNLGQEIVEGKDSGSEVYGEQEQKAAVDENRSAESFQLDIGKPSVVTDIFSDANMLWQATAEGKDSGSGTGVDGEQEQNEAMDGNRGPGFFQLDIGTTSVATDNFFDANKFEQASVKGKDSGGGSEVGGEHEQNAGMQLEYSKLYGYNMKKESILEILQPPIQIFVKNWNGKTTTLYVQQNDTITDVKNKIFQKLGYSADFHSLVFVGKSLEGSRSLASYGIEKYSTLHMVLQPSTLVRPFKLAEIGGLPPDQKRSATIRHLKKMIQNKMGKPVKEVLLRGLAVRDEISLFECDIEDNTVMGIIFFRIWEPLPLPIRRGMQLEYSKLYGYNMKKESILEILQPPIQIFVKNWNGKTTTLYVQQNDTISDVKNKIFQKLGYSADFHGLVFAGKSLEGGRSLASYGIEKYSTLHMVLQPSTLVRPFKLAEIGGFPPDQKRSTTIRHLKKMVENKMGKPVKEVLLCGLAVRDEISLFECDIEDDTLMGIVFIRIWEPLPLPIRRGSVSIVHAFSPPFSVPSDAKASRNAKSNNNSSHNSMLPNKDGGVVQEVPPGGQIMTSNLKMFMFAELKSATRNFGPDRVLGEGGFGKVYQGWLDEKTYAPSKTGVGKAVVIKRFKLSGLQGLEEEKTKVEFLGNFTHPNLVKLLGYSKDEEFFIVSEYMQNGSLYSHLFRSAKPLPWFTRVKIAIGAARGIAFLHTTDNEVILRSVESSDILLDGDFNAKLSDFGLVKTGRRYIAPEYVDTGRVSLKSNVYCFGIVLLEILTGKRVIDFVWPSGNCNLVDWAWPFLPNKTKLKRVIDPRLEHDYPPEGAFQLAGLIIQCLDLSPIDRPSMEEVLESLEQINAIKDETK